MSNSLLFYYIYVENLTILLLSRECIVCVTHDCPSRSLPVVPVSLWLPMGTTKLPSNEVQEEDSILVVRFGHKSGLYLCHYYGIYVLL